MPSAADLTPVVLTVPPTAFADVAALLLEADVTGPQSLEHAADIYAAISRHLRRAAALAGKDCRLVARRGPAAVEVSPSAAAALRKAGLAAAKAEAE